MRIWSLLKIGLLTAVAAFGVVDAYGAGSATGIANFLIFGASGILTEVLYSVHERTPGKYAAVAYGSAAILWFASFMALIVWNMTGPYSVAVFYACLFAPWLAFTTYLAYSVFSRNPPSDQPSP